MAKGSKKEYRDFSNVKNVRENLVPEEFPEGPVGSSINADEPPYSKTTPWTEGQRRQSAFVYPDKDQHDELPRKTPGSHPLHDESGDATDDVDDLDDGVNVSDDLYDEEQ
ncbi:hypothetical protein [Virgibacillus ihumii]|uniref:hypothetical protein n=1 Tax=Virgibacillus ihumii TaxID=2686091 RepID=UPI001FEB9197|nr:hypothetical protein [Virgibacillus ihumii]